MSETGEYNIELLNRQIEISEWTYNNKMDTVFVFQIIFIALLFVGVLMILNKTGLVGWGFVLYSSIVVGVLVSIIIINRAVYTNSTRDKRHWTRKQFANDNSIDSPLGRGDNSTQDYIDSIRDAYGKPTPAPAPCACPTSC